MADTDCVQVALRIRPLVKTEIDKGCQEVVDRIVGEPQVLLKNHDSFTFNYVFGKNETQEIVYEDGVQSMIEKLFSGYNVTILAYGQTGSGKTHTMGTAFNGEKNSEMGVIPRAMHDIFNKVNEMSDSYQISVSCSFMELYQETLYDLLTTATREQSAVDIREDVNKGIVIPGLTEILVSSAEETTSCLIKGSSGRAVGATAMNEQSSRSHAIFTLNINIMKNNEVTSMTTSKFNLVDLAGSERPKKTKATGDRFKEGVNINKGLLALGNVISALGSTQNTYVSYRDSKLTRLLQDSLGGNSITLMIACISPADYNLDETISTLRYADRARKIKNKPVINQDPQRAEINRLNNVIQSLRLQLLGQGKGSLTNLENIENCSDGAQEIKVLRKHNLELIEKNQQLRQQLQATLQDVAEIESRASIAEETHDKLLIKFNEMKNFFMRKENINNESKNSEFNDLNKIHSVIDEIDNIFKENREELMSQKSENNSINDLTFCVQPEEVQQRYDQFTTKQLEINNEIRKLTRELALKESHHEKVSTNLTKFCDYEANNENLAKEFEIKVKILEAEKSDLLDKLKCVKDNVSAKIAEERRKRLQQLEHEILDMRKKILQQDKLLKVREKEAQKIINLNKEIQQMKAAKVNLVKTMRKESETFRQWKLNREKQLTQLKEKDRKRQNEMIRMEALHNKQKNVLKRKVEEAIAVNKRLKDVLEKQKQAQAKRNGNNVQTGKTDQFLTLIDHELELILSVVDAQNTLDQLMDDRASINQRLKELKLEKPTNTKEIKAIENDLSLRNAQINDLQQKILSSDITGKIKSICEGVSSLPEARTGLKYLFNSLMDLRREFAIKDNKIEEYKSAYETVEEKVNNLQVIIKENEIKCQDNENKYKEKLMNTERSYEEKISVLLRELSKLPQTIDNTNNDPELSERLQIQQETLDKIDCLREELDLLKNQCKEYESIIQKQNNKKNGIKEIKKKIRTELNYDQNEEEDFEEEFEENFGTDEEIGEDSFSNDPDWKYTPRFKRNRSDTKINRKKPIQNEISQISGVKRNSDGIIKCKCKTNCSRKNCSCRSNGIECNERCSCSESCVNITKQNSVNATAITESTFIKDNKENIQSNSNLNESIDIFSSPSGNEKELNTPKKFKNLQGEDENKLDVTTPTYPFLLKKRTPFYK